MPSIRFLTVHGLTADARGYQYFARCADFASKDARHFWVQRMYLAKIEQQIDNWDIPGSFLERLEAPGRARCLAVLKRLPGGADVIARHREKFEELDRWEGGEGWPSNDAKKAQAR